MLFIQPPQCATNMVTKPVQWSVNGDEVVGLTCAGGSAS